MPDRQNIHLLYKNLGETPLQTVLRFKKDNPEYTEVPLTYAGRLDPMAEGLLLVLSGEKVNDKEKFLGLSKTYVTEILWGFETDTLDVLGVGKSCEGNIPEENKVIEFLRHTEGKFEQLYPVYSSRPVNGKSLFEWAREGRISEVLIPKHEVEIFEARHISRRFIFREDLLKDILSKISLVIGDFRQKELTAKWQEVLVENSSTEFVIDKISVTVSGGFYVRQFISDLAEELGTKAVTFHIKRTKIGEFEVNNSS